MEINKEREKKQMEAQLVYQVVTQNKITLSSGFLSSGAGLQSQRAGGYAIFTKGRFKELLLGDPNGVITGVPEEVLI